MIVSIISMHQSDFCRNLYVYSDEKDYFVLLEEVGINLSYMLFFTGLIFIYYYSNIIKKWKGLPEE